MRYLILPAALALFIVLPGTATASDIFKWTDKDGNVHYTDKPVGEQSERVDIQSRPTDDNKVQARIQVQLEQQAGKDTADEQSEPANEEPDDAGPDDAERVAEEQHRSERCDTAMERQGRFERSRRLYREDENGERVYLDESESDKARARVQDQIRKYCNS